MMMVSFLAFLLFTVVYTYDMEHSTRQSHKVVGDKKYDYNSATMTPIIFKTVSDPRKGETWLTLYYGRPWGQLRFSEKKLGA